MSKRFHCLTMGTIWDALISAFDLELDGKMKPENMKFNQDVGHWDSRSPNVRLYSSFPTENTEDITLETADGFVLLNVNATLIGFQADSYAGISHNPEEIEALARADKFCGGLISALLLRYGMLHGPKTPQAKASRVLAEAITARPPQ